jgi:uncharacterized phage protein (TIGR02220 family)
MRIRTIKPTFWTNDELAELPALTRLLFIGLWGLADVRGRLEDRPKRIKAAVLPYDDHDIDSALAALKEHGFLHRYTVGDLSVIQIVNFEKHQRISGKEADTESDFPEFDPALRNDQPEKRRGSAGEAPGSPEGKGREGNKEGKGKDISPVVVAGAEVPGVEAAPVTADDSTSKRYTEARVVLHALNEAAGRHYRETQANLDFIRARLSEPDVTVDGCIAMIRRQVARWGSDPKMAEFLRPETLFNRTKFDSYYANRDLPAETAGNGNGQRIGGPNLNAHVAGVADRIRERREQWDREDPDAPPPGFEREPKLALPGLGPNGNPPQG